jgi:hypothetical protein
MSPIHSFRVGSVVVLVSALSWGAVAACSSTSNPTPPVYSLDASIDATGDAHSRVPPKGDATSDGRADGPATSDVVVVAPNDALPTDGRVPDDVLIDVAVIDGHFVDAAVCQTDGGCYQCSPTTNAEFLNQCTTSVCVPFDNATRLPSFDGGLAPLGS